MPLFYSAQGLSGMLQGRRNRYSWYGHGRTAHLIVSGMHSVAIEADISL